MLRDSHRSPAAAHAPRGGGRGRVFPALALVLLLACGVGAPAASPWTLGPPLPELEGRGRDRAEIFARIDALEEELEAMVSGEERARIQRRLAELYLATGLRKHHRKVLDLLGQALHDDPSDFSTARLRAELAQRMRYTRQAQAWLEEATHDFAGDGRAFEALGRFQFVEGRRRLQSARFERARAAFQRAVLLDPDSVAGWRGLAFSALALGDDAQALRAARALQELGAEGAVGSWVEAAAAVGTGEEALARRRFEEALAVADSVERAVFVAAEGFLDEQDLEGYARRFVAAGEVRAAMLRLGETVDTDLDLDWKKALEDPRVRRLALAAYWRDRDRRPARVFNPARLRYWRRLVLADLLFGDPETGRRGWESVLGQVWVRWGRPTSTFYSPGVAGAVLDELDVAQVRLPLEESVPEETPFWVWTWKESGRWFSFLFLDPSRQARWSMASESSYQMGIRRRQQALALQEETLPPSDLEIALGRALFPRSQDTLVETHVAVRSSAEDSSVAGEAARAAPAEVEVEWSLFDAQDRRLDHRVERLDASHRRRRLQEAVGERPWPARSDPFLLSIGARLPPGSYRIAVEARRPGEQGRRSARLDVRVPEPEPAALLALSDLQLTAANGAYRPGEAIDPRLVKFGRVVVPVPDLRIPAGADAAGVYFEVRHLATGPDGKTSFDVRYEMYRSTRATRGLFLSGTDPSGTRRLRGIDPLTLTYLREQTGVSREGVVIKGSRLDLAQLPPGEYVLVVVVRDRIGGREARSALAFRRRGP